MTEWAGVIVGLIALAGTIWNNLSNRGVRRADAASKLTGSAMDIVERLEKRVAALESERDELTRRVESLYNENITLRHRVRELEAALALKS